MVLFWETYCHFCGAEIALPRSIPPFGAALVCPRCKTPIHLVHKVQDCPVSCSPEEMKTVFGYERCSLEHPRCPWCGKLVYAVIFPERGPEVAWYAVQQQQNPMANYTIEVKCVHCTRTFIVEWDEWPFPIDSTKRCNFCTMEVTGDENPSGIPKDRLDNFERLLGRKASTVPYLNDTNGNKLWYACPVCWKKAVKKYHEEQGDALSQAYSLGLELDPFVNELLMIDQTDGLMDERGIMGNRESCYSAYDSEHRHKRGRKIGEILCRRGGTELMQRIADAFIDRGGMEWRLSHCWHEIRDDTGHITWLA